MMDSAGIVCTECGFTNPSWHVTCERCGARLTRPDDADVSPPARPERPGCIVTWAFVFGGYLLLYIGLTLFDISTDSDFMPEDGIFMLLLVALLAAAFVIIGGVWFLKPWARIPAIGLHLVIMMLFIGGQIYALSQDDDTTSTREEQREAVYADLCSGATWAVLNGYVIYWFATHREAFGSPSRRR